MTILFGQISLSHRVEIGTLLSTMGIFFSFLKNALKSTSSRTTWTVIHTYLTKITNLIDISFFEVWLITASILRCYNVHHQVGKCTLVVAQVLFQRECGIIIFVAQSESKQSKLLAVGLQYY